MKYFYFQNRFSKLRYLLIIILAVLLLVFSLNHVSVKNESTRLRVEQEWIANEIKETNARIEYFNSLLEENKAETEEKRNLVMESVEELTVYVEKLINLKRPLDKSIVELDFNQNFTPSFVTSLLEYKLELVDILTVDKMSVDFPQDNINLSHEVVDLAYLEANEIYNDLFAVHVYERVFLNVLGNLMLAVFVILLINQVRFLHWRKHSFLSCAPLGFKKQFIAYYGKWLLMNTGLFTSLFISFYMYLVIKRVTPNYGLHSVLMSNSGNIKAINFFVIAFIAVIGWLLLAFIAALVKDIVSLWMNENLISTIISIGFIIWLNRFLNLYQIGINVKLIEFNSIIFHYGMRFSLSSTMIGIFSLIVISSIFVGIIRYFYGKLE